MRWFRVIVVNIDFTQNYTLPLSWLQITTGVPFTVASEET